ncbi:hypothetical protein F4860DRAFT_480216 [Xylaria cubensis]|nr:hypothetical protein F4860DRAFT_480216 [Xylaria cubensis]
MNSFVLVYSLYPTTPDRRAAFFVVVLWSVAIYRISLTNAKTPQANPAPPPLFQNSGRPSSVGRSVNHYHFQSNNTINPAILAHPQHPQQARQPNTETLISFPLFLSAFSLTFLAFSHHRPVPS